MSNGMPLYGLLQSMYIYKYLRSILCVAILEPFDLKFYMAVIVLAINILQTETFPCFGIEIERGIVQSVG